MEPRKQQINVLVSVLVISGLFLFTLSGNVGYYYNVPWDSSSVWD